jgi:hypothetical protein
MAKKRSKAPSTSSRKRRPAKATPRNAARRKSGSTRSGAARPPTGTARAAPGARRSARGTASSGRRAARELGVAAALAKGDRVRLLEDILPGRAGQTGIVTEVFSDGSVTVQIDEGFFIGPTSAGRFARI